MGKKKEAKSLLNKCDSCDNRGIDVRRISGEPGAFCWKCFQPSESEAMKLSAELLAVYCDGGVVSKNPSTIGGTWGWCAVNSADERVIERAGFVPTTLARTLITNNHTEQIAIVLALEAMPTGWSGTVYSDSQIALGRIFKGYACRNLPMVIQTRTQAALRRLGVLKYVHLSGHPTKQELMQGYSDRHETRLPVSIHNKWCDEAATQVAERVKVALTQVKTALALAGK